MKEKIGKEDIHLYSLYKIYLKTRAFVKRGFQPDLMRRLILVSWRGGRRKLALSHGLFGNVPILNPFGTLISHILLETVVAGMTSSVL